jgi:hypothetical protein
MNFSLTIRGAKQHFVKYQLAAAKSELHSQTACVIVVVSRARRALKAEMKTNEVMLLRQLPRIQWRDGRTHDRLTMRADRARIAPAKVIREIRSTHARHPRALV